MKNYFEYNGYIGSIEVSVDDNCLYGRIEFINDLVTFQGSTIEELESSFKESVDDYLSTCVAQGKDPDKPFSGSFNVRIGQKLHKEVALAAKKAGTTLNDHIKQVLEKSISEDNRPIIHVHKQDMTVHHIIETTKPFVFNEDITNCGVLKWTRPDLTSSRI